MHEVKNKYLNLRTHTYIFGFWLLISSFLTSYILSKAALNLSADYDSKHPIEIYWVKLYMVVTFVAYGLVALSSVVLEKHDAFAGRSAIQYCRARWFIPLSEYSLSFGSAILGTTAGLVLNATWFVQSDINPNIIELLLRLFYTIAIVQISAFVTLHTLVYVDAVRTLKYACFGILFIIIMQLSMIDSMNFYYALMGIFTILLLPINFVLCHTINRFGIRGRSIGIANDQFLN